MRVIRTWPLRVCVCVLGATCCVMSWFNAETHRGRLLRLLVR
jgi:hypothetical protein